MIIRVHCGVFFALSVDIEVLSNKTVCKLCCKTVMFLLQLIKYGVISTDALMDDLLHWKTMYIAGRLHKPVRISHFSLSSSLIRMKSLLGKRNQFGLNSGVGLGRLDPVK